MKKTLLIVGGTGFIGYNVALKAVNMYNVIILSSNKCAIERHIDNVLYITSNLRNSEDLHDELFNRNIDYVINLGGYVNHSDFFHGGDDTIRIHFAGLFNLIKSLNVSKLKSFVQIGSGDEYGLSTAPQQEDQRELPASPYAFAKTAANHFIQMLHRQNDFPGVCLRVYLTYGPGQNENRFIPQIIKGCLSNKKFPTSEGNQLRDFVYIDDLVDGILSALKSRSAYGEIINISSNCPVMIKDVIQIICNECESGKPVFGEISYRKNENMAWYGDGKKANNILNWTPQTDFVTGIRTIIKEYYK